MALGGPPNCHLIFPKAKAEVEYQRDAYPVTSNDPTVTKKVVSILKKSMKPERPSARVARLSGNKQILFVIHVF